MITEGLSEAKLKFGYWYVTHKELLRQIFIYVLFFITINLWLTAIFFIVKVYSFDNQDFASAVNRFSNPMVNYSTFNKANQPQNIRLVGNIDVLKSRDNKYDILANVNNPNNNWIARISGYFSIDGVDYNEQKTSILANESKYVIQTGIESGVGIQSVQFKITNVQWQRIRNKNLFNRYIKDRSDFVVENIEYKNPDELSLGNQVPIGSLSFSITNNSVYDYWLLNNKILFKRGGRPVSVQIVPVNEFKAEQKRFVDFRIFDSLVNISSVEVRPDIDIFDDNNIIEEPLVVGHLK